MKILKFYEGGRGPGPPISEILSQFSINNYTKMFHTKFHQNRMINEDFKILGGGGGGPPICEIWSSLGLGGVK